MPVHICHIILRLGYGGMENGLVAIVNATQGAEFRHTILCIEDATEFRERVDPRVPVECLKGRYTTQAGKFRAVWQALREIKPDIVHTRNLPTIDLYPVILAAGVRRMVHSEHGVDLLEIGGSPWKYRMIRRAGALAIPAYVALSRQLADWMVAEGGIPRRKITLIINGVDTDRFAPAQTDDERARLLAGFPAAVTAQRPAVIGSLGRLERVKDHENLAYAFVEMAERRPDLRETCVLAIGGDGSRRAQVEAILTGAGLRDRLAMPGYTADPPSFYRALDVFVLPSKSEGTSNTILEAMACALPVIATDAGESAHLVEDGQTGAVVPPNNPHRLADALIAYAQSPNLRARHGAAGRRRARTMFSLDAMLESYATIYRALAR